MDDAEISEMLPQDSVPDEPEKKRHWAAWTREEEEMFFVALKQVGKNFEGITSHVKSKNKNQVRHYYYRLIKRMNKLINPELLLDAKNYKDVTSAMLYWWSLLEKYKCSYSKLHLKPRRMKAFISALEIHLRKDRRKSAKKPGKASSDVAEASTAMDFPVQSRKKPRTPSKKKKPIHNDPGSCLDLLAGTTEPSSALVVNPNLVIDPVCIQLNNDNGVGVFSSVLSHPPFQVEQSVADKTPDIERTSKFKLQLFPLDDVTKAALEQDGHNPHLELTLKASKSIGSVLHHLKQKWGHSKVASGELRLYPYSARPFVTSWGMDDTLVSASDVHAAVGKPVVFRLKYGWTSEDYTVMMETDEHEIQKRKSPVAVDVQTDRRELRDTGCNWLYEQSSDGFGQRLWQDEDQLHNSSSAPGMDWIQRLTGNVKPGNSNGGNEQSRQNEQDRQVHTTSTASIWGGDEACDAFSFKHKEQMSQVAPFRPLAIKQPEAELSLLGSDSQGADILRSSSLDLYWADSLGVEGSFGALAGQAALLNGNSSLGISGALFPDNSLDGFPLKKTQ